MKNYLKKDPWKIIEDSFHPEYNKISESIFSIGNGHIGQRANFEEHYSGETLQGNYVGGIYYPDKTKVGWWKNGYPEYFAKVLNSANWIGIDILIDGERLDLNKCRVISFNRTLDMKKGLLRREVHFKTSNHKEFKLKSERFCHYANKELAFLDYQITSVNHESKIIIKPYLDFDIINQDSNYDEKFWSEISKGVNDRQLLITCATKKTDFHVCTGISCTIAVNGSPAKFNLPLVSSEKFASYQGDFHLAAGGHIAISKICAITNSLNHDKDKVQASCELSLAKAEKLGFEAAKESHKKAWADKWDECDVVIEGDVAAQQGIRFNIFQLYQTYTGDDPRLNIGPKGFTGEKYGGSTYWDTEAYCLPFYMSTAEYGVGRNLLYYRYEHLQKAIENAQKLGFSKGAALYPMVTMNGEECHNEWEITFEEIHRNGAIAYAIYDYVRYTNNRSYLIKYGLEVLIAISRFWAQRVNYSRAKNQYVILGVTGPNEYENNVNNNWYTNYIAKWCMTYTRNELLELEREDGDALKNIISKTKLNIDKELNLWNEICENLYFPSDEEREVFLQQDGFLDKDIKPTSAIEPSQRPINQFWSWDRILRSVYIKQADVLQGLYFFEDNFDEETIRRNFDFYEPLTVHESSLSPCVHSILASKLRKYNMAYKMYLRTSRLDLDDYNNDTEDGCHITSMAGSWMSIVKGFAGMRIKENKLSFDPYLPEQWLSYKFKFKFRKRLICVKVEKSQYSVELLSGEPLQLLSNGNVHQLNKELIIRDNLQLEN